MQQLFTNPTVFIFESPIKGENIEFTLDVTSMLNTTMSGKVTSYPLEGGGNVSDHFQANPLTLAITGMISQSPSQWLSTLATSIATNAALANSPKGLSNTFKAAVASSIVLGRLAGNYSGSSKELLGSPYTTLLNNDNRSKVSPKEYPKQAMLGLIKMFEAGNPFRIRTYFSEEIYSNMVITNLSFNQSAQTGESLPFTMSCQKVTVVKKFEGQASELKAVDPVGSSAEETTDAGKKTKIAKKKPRSLLHEKLGLSPKKSL